MIPTMDSSFSTGSARVLLFVNTKSVFNQGAKYVLVHLNALSGLIDLEGWFRYINQDSFWILINLEVWFRYFNQDLFRTHKPGRLVPFVPVNQICHVLIML